MQEGIDTMGLDYASIRRDHGEMLYLVSVSFSFRPCTAIVTFAILPLASTLTCDLSRPWLPSQSRRPTKAPWPNTFLTHRSAGMYGGSS